MPLDTLNGILLLAALASGLLTIVFVLVSLGRMGRKQRSGGVRALAATLIASLITAGLTIYQLIAAAAQLNLR